MMTKSNRFNQAEPTFTIFPSANFPDNFVIFLAPPFHVTDANKMLASVNKMTEAGNRVEFNRRRSFIESPDGKKAYLRKRGGVYVLDVIFFDGDDAVKGEVIIDSRAADNVMQKDILTRVTMKEKERGTKFVAANGRELGNYGRKDVQFCPVDFARRNQLTRKMLLAPQLFATTT